MVLLALRRASSLDWLLIDEFDRLSGQVYRQHHQADSTADVSSRKRRMKKEEHWTIQRDEEHDSIKIINDVTNNNSSAEISTAEMHVTQLIHTLQTIRYLTTKSLPELSSRIIHATSPILHELSRGYFVPFLTVALACLGRIHVLILRLGRELVGTLSQHVPKLRDCVADGGKEEKGDGGGGSLIKLKEALTPFIVSMHTMNEGREPSNEWNELMKPFTEISHDEFTKNMSNFVKDRRWKDAITAFGIKKDDLNELQLLSQQSSDAYGNEDGDGNGESMNIDDMGELVYMQQEHDDEKDGTKRSNVDVDDNMARVLDKRRIDETSSTATAKKKKRRRRKKKSAVDSEANEDVADNAVKTGDDEGDEAERKQSDDNIKKIAEENANAASKQSNNEVNSSTDVQLQSSRLSPKESSNSGDDAMIDAQQSKVDAVTKKEKKSKKRKTKKKKSKNVIDDIFG